MTAHDPMIERSKTYIGMGASALLVITRNLFNVGLGASPARQRFDRRRFGQLRQAQAAPLTLHLDTIVLVR